MAAFVEEGVKRPPVRRLCAKDCFIPLGEAATATLPDRDGIVALALELAASSRKASDATSRKASEESSRKPGDATRGAR
jgi:hypothetical protein